MRDEFVTWSALRRSARRSLRHSGNYVPEPEQDELRALGAVGDVLLGGWVNVLVTDRQVAGRLLEEAPDQPVPA